MDDTGLDEATPVVVTAGGMDVLLVRQGGTIHAIGDVCGHAGGPLHEGDLERGCVICPWHASTFRLADGAAVHGPATAPQPAFDTQVAEGRIQVRRRA